MSRTVNQGTVTIAETATIQCGWTSFHDPTSGGGDLMKTTTSVLPSDMMGLGGQP